MSVQFLYRVGNSRKNQRSNKLKYAEIQEPSDLVCELKLQ